MISKDSEDTDKQMERTAENSSCRFIHGLPARYVLALLSFFGFVLNYMLRINMSITIVAMVNTNRSSRYMNDSNVEDSEKNSSENGEFNWDEKTQSLIIGSFFWGYILTQIPGGRLAEIFGSKYIFGLSILLSGIVTLFVPLAAEENPTKLICLRILLGILEGASYPAMHAMLGRWAPPLERSRLTSLVYSGSQAGTVLALPLGGLIISAWGWKLVFYVMGVLPMIWFLFWMYFVYDSPQIHPRISVKERQYLTESIDAISMTERKSLPVPWLQILRSKPFWAIIAASLASNWGFWTLLILLPTYMKNILHFDIKANAFLSAIPYVTMWIFGVLYSLLADWSRRKEIFNTETIRKISTTLCTVVPAITLYAVTFVDLRPIATVVLFTFAVGMSGAKYSAYLSNHIDIAPNFAGTLLGIANSFSTLPGWIAPLTAAALINGQQTLVQWHKVFYLASVIYIIGCVFYLIFASGEVQVWNKLHNVHEEVMTVTTDRSINNSNEKEQIPPVTPTPPDNIVVPI